MIARGNPKALLADPPDPKVRAFLTRGQPAATTPPEAGGGPVAAR
jgi:hypothetical protein